MLNHKGGRVIFGVDAKGRIVGQDVADKTLEDVAAYLRRRAVARSRRSARLGRPPTGFIASILF